MIDLPEFRSVLLTGLLGQTQFLENIGHQAKVGESALEQVKANKGRKPEPIGVDVVGQGKTYHNHGSGDHM